MRTFLLCEKSKEEVDKIIKQHDFYKEAGPLWTGQLWDNSLVKKMAQNNKQQENRDFLNIIKGESAINEIGFHDIHTICKKEKTKTVPKKEDVMKKIKKLSYKAASTHFLPTGIKSDIPLKKLISIVKAHGKK